MQYLTEEHYKIAKKNGIKEATLYRRVYQYKWDIEKAIKTPVIPRSKRARKYPKRYTDLALSNGICLVTFYTRLNNGWSIEKASTLPPLPVNKRRSNKIGGMKNDKE